MAGGIPRPRNDSAEDLPETHEINVTPFIDVVLVLLIVFMVAAPLATVDVNVDLPGATAQPAERPDAPLYLTLQSDLTLALGNDPVTREGLAAQLQQVTGGDRDTRIFLRADKVVAYGDLMETMNELRRAGYLKIALIGLEAAPADQVTADPAAAAPEGATP